MNFYIRNKRLHGITLVEMMIAILMLSILVSVLFYLTNTVNRVTYSERLYEDLKEGSQRALRVMDHDAIRAKKFFGRSSPYENLIPYSDIPSPANFSELPIISPNGLLDPEASGFDASIFGNQLFFAKVENSAAFETVDKSYDINLFRFVCFYLTVDTNYAIRPYDYSLALVKWESGLYADYWDVERLWSDTIAHPLDSIKRILEDTFGVEYCWDVSSPDPDSAFYRIGSMTYPVSINFGTASARYLVKSINQIMGVSFNGSDEFPIKSSVPGFASTSGEFPGGFEVAIIGPSSSRKVFINLVVAGWTRKRVLDYGSMTVVSAPEY